MASKNFGFRIPGEILSKIEALATGEGKNRTEVLISLLRRGLAIAPSPTSQPAPSLESRVEALEKEVQTLGSAIQRLTEASYSAIQCHTETSNTAIQTPNNTVKQSSNSVGQSQVSDATLRRLARKAGLTLGDFAAREGWLKQGTGNRAIWVKE